MQTYLFSEVLLKLYTNTHTPRIKEIGRKRNWKKIEKNGKGQDKA